MKSENAEKFHLKTNKNRPLIRWVGGKYWLLKEIERFLPAKIENYHEPFFGGGSIFLNLNHGGRSLLSDVNFELINFYKVLRDDTERLIQKLKLFKNTDDFYYEMRDKNYTTDLEKAARFYYLNRTSFNGIYRVNTKGTYNVPYGHKNYKTLFCSDEIRQLSKLFKNSELTARDFEKSFEEVKEGDFVFLDPPYTVSHGNNGFIQYNEKLFSWEDQNRLAKCIKGIIEKGAYFILTNAWHKEIKELFGFSGVATVLSRTSIIGGKNAFRGEVKEYLFTNVKDKG